MTRPTVARIAVPAPLRQYFDYRCENTLLKPGMRVSVPFRGKEMVGIFVEWVVQPDVAWDKLKPINGVLDLEPILTDEILQLCFWGADYYNYPIGEVLSGALPLLLRQGKPAVLAYEEYWQLTEEGEKIDPGVFKRAVKQQGVIELLRMHPNGLNHKDLRGFSKAILKSLQKKGYVRVRNAILMPGQFKVSPALTLNLEQQAATDAINANTNHFKTFLIEGVTGSGKTEIYLQTIANVLALGQQVLVLVPEIGLTPQTVKRFRERFIEPVVVLHSGLSEKERLNAWLAAKQNIAKIIIGTRSAIFTPFANLGLIVIDEEHDLSFKQQEGFRYHARDLAIVRAHFQKIPIVLGSATPSLESLQNVDLGRYHHLRLTQRAGSAKAPTFDIIDICKLPLEQGLSQPLLSEMKVHLDAGNQVMVFLNRRGFSPVLMCHGCGWIAMCKRCDMRMTYHQQPKRLHCHHCDATQVVTQKCQKCEGELYALGVGTERLENVLQKYFPTKSIVRIDRDTTQKKGAIEDLLSQVHNGEHQLLIGTQMLAKGHHFPDVTLVAIIDADAGFFSADFRAIERTGQLLLQVAGRAGRMEKPGKVLIQTHHPSHPLLHQLLHESYSVFAASLLKERKETFLPPHIFFALFRAEAYDAAYATSFLQQIKTASQAFDERIRLIGPIFAPISRRAGRHRMQLLVQASQRPILQNFIKMLLPEIDKLPNKQRVRWSLDIDPLEIF